MGHTLELGNRSFVSRLFGTGIEKQAEHQSAQTIRDSIGRILGTNFVRQFRLPRDIRPTPSDFYLNGAWKDGCKYLEYPVITIGRKNRKIIIIAQNNSGSMNIWFELNGNNPFLLLTATYPFLTPFRDTLGEDYFLPFGSDLTTYIEKHVPDTNIDSSPLNFADVSNLVEEIKRSPHKFRSDRTLTECTGDKDREERIKRYRWRVRRSQTT